MTGEQPGVDDVLMNGWHGAPEVRPLERRHYLGELAERVLAVVTKAEAEGEDLQEAVAQAARDPRAKAIIAHADIPFEDRLKYSRLADEAGLDFTIRSDPSLTGETGLIVVSDAAVLGQP